MRQRILTGLASEFPAWTRSLSSVLERFDEWLCDGMAREMSELSKQHHGDFVAPVQRVSRQLSQSLQDFRNRLSERTLEALGVPLRTTQIDLQTQDPRSPDVRVGKVLRFWRAKSNVSVDIYNLTNSDAARSVNNSYASWVNGPRPTSVVLGRFAKLSATFDF